MEQLWSPWRSKYIGSFKGKDKIEQCFVCHAINHPTEDEDNLLVARFEHSIVMMNKYPYNNGHLLITPKDHNCLLYISPSSRDRQQSRMPSFA